MYTKQILKVERNKERNMLVVRLFPDAERHGKDVPG